MSSLRAEQFFTSYFHSGQFLNLRSTLAHSEAVTKRSGGGHLT